MFMQFSTSVYPAVALPSSDVISNPKIREAAEQHVGALQRVSEAHAIAGKLKAGHNLDDLTPDQIASAIATSRDGLTVQAEARERLLEALGQHRAEWTEDTAKQAAKAHTAAVKALRSAQSALDEYELRSGVLAMLNSGSPELKMRPSDAVYEIGAVRQPLAAVIDKLAAGEDQ